MDNGTKFERERYRALYVFKALPGREAELENELIVTGREIRNDPGFLGLTCARSTVHPGGFMTLTRWEDRVTLSSCFLTRKREGMVDRIAALCETVGLDVLVPHDLPGAQGPEPGRVGGLIASRLMLPRPENVEEAQAFMEERMRQLQVAQGCLWVIGNVHADRSDYLHILAGWETAEAYDVALKTFTLPLAWADPKDRVNVVALDRYEPLLELLPDRLSAARVQAHP